MKIFFYQTVFIMLMNLMLNITAFSQKELLGSTTMINETQEVTSLNGTANDNFGLGIDINGDTAVVGASLENSEQGAVYVYVRNGTTWDFQQRLTASDGASNDFFGIGVAIDSDTIIVGASRDDIGMNTDQGSAYIFTRSGGVWSQQTKITASDGAAEDYFGNVVDLDGNTSVIGAPEDDLTLSNAGSAYIYTGSGSSWTFQQKISNTSHSAVNDQFGSAVSLDGDRVLIGSFLRDITGGGTDQGAIYFYTRSGITWSLEQTVNGPGNEFDFFGSSVSLEGNRAAIGAHFVQHSGFNRAGAAYIYEFNGSTWSFEQQLLASDPDLDDFFGISISLSGTKVLIGARGNNGQGAAYEFTLNGGIWTENTKLVASNGAPDDFFGERAVLDGTTAFIGSRQHDVPAASPLSQSKQKSNNFAGANQGVAYFFNLLPPTAANASINGRVFSANNRGLSNAIVQMSDSVGTIRSVRTNQFGYYKFENIVVGQTLVFIVFRKNYQFDTQIINFDDSITGLNFIAQ